MLFRKSLVLVVCLGLLAACSSAQSDVSGESATSGLSREEAETEWASRVGKVWTTKVSVGSFIDDSSDYWLNSAEVSDVLLKNGYYSQTIRSDGFPASFSRGFCGGSSYDDVIAENIGNFLDGEPPEATSIGFINLGGAGEGPKLGNDSMLVSVSMTVFKVFQFKSGKEFSNDLYRSIQDKIASQSSDRCSFQMRRHLKDGTKFGAYENMFIRDWWTEKDLICAKKPCLYPGQKVESLLSKQGASAGGGFYLLQSNLTGRPTMRSVVFVPRPAENALLLFEVISTRNGHTEKKISGELAERHAAVAAELSIAWLKKSARSIQLDELDTLYAKAQPLSENAVPAIYSNWSRP